MSSDLILPAAMFTVYDFNTDGEDVVMYGGFGNLHPSDFVSVGERPLFRGSINDDDSNSESTNEIFSPQSLSVQGEDFTRKGTLEVFIDPASSDSLFRFQ